MSREIRFRPEAHIELYEAASWYEQRRPGLGSEFLGRVEEALDRIREFPELSPRVHGPVRQVLVRQFPYAVYFRDDRDPMKIIAVFHASRDPQEWKRRL